MEKANMVKEGQPMSRNNKVKMDSLRKSIYSLLSNNGMTHDDLIGHFLSVPGIQIKDLDLITVALNNLSESDLLRVTFRTNKHKLTVEPVFRVSLRKHNVRGF